jgi:hypothetical protein
MNSMRLSALGDFHRKRYTIPQAVVAAQRRGLTPAQIADEYGLTKVHVKEASAFYEVRRSEIDADLAGEPAMEDRDRHGTR